MNPGSIVAFLPKLLGLSAPALAFLGALVVTLTAVQALLLAVGKVLPASSKVARYVGIAALDVGKAIHLAGVIVVGVKRAAAFIGSAGKAGLVMLVLVLTGCTPAELQTAKKVAIAEIPVLAQVDAIGAVIAQAVGWCEVHGATPDTVAEAKQAIANKDLPTAVDVVRKMLIANAAAGVPIPGDVVALVQTAEGAMAADGIEKGMRALSAPKS